MTDPVDNPYGDQRVRRRRSPRSLAGALARIRGQATPQTLLASVQEHWASAAGEEIARQAVPISEQGGVVTVACASSVWAGELEMMAPSLLEKLNGRLPGGPSVAAFRFVTRPV